MPSLSFKAQFATRVANGEKPHTIRRTRVRPIKVDDALSFFTGMRTKQCRRLRPNAPCTAAVCIALDVANREIHVGEGSRFYPHGKLSAVDLLMLAQRDGFTSLEEFWGFFQAQHVGFFSGQLIEWQP